MIRPATLGDIPALLEMGRKFAERANLQSHVGYDPHSMVQTFEALINGEHPLFIGERGAIGATCTPHPFNCEHITVQELFWWSEGREGLALLKALEAYCVEHAHSLQMITLEAVEPERTGRLYEKLGFAPLEHSYIKVF
jgi:N-acetylglutamate synthase-like GNAT family acetyltransferase